MPIVITQPIGNQRFIIDPAAAGMPAINCQARIAGVRPDPTANTVFDWFIEITEAVVRDTCASSRIGNCTLRVPQRGVASVMGGRWRPVFPNIQGGDAVITVSAAGLQQTVNVRVRGQNAAPATVTAALGGAGSTDQIACHESGRRQFNADGMPLPGPGGDIGIMQLCNPAATCLQRWSWTDNVTAGLNLFAEKQRAARNYLNRHQVDGNYPNDQGFADAIVLQYEAIQRYNGGTYWTWNADANQWQANPANRYVARVLAC